MAVNHQRRHKILVITDDALAVDMAGPAIRAWQIATALSADHEVRLASTTRTELSSPHFAVCEGNVDMVPGLVADMDVIITQGFTMRRNPVLQRSSAKIVCDLYDPLHLETVAEQSSSDLAVGQRRLTAAIDALDIQMRRGDFFICASEQQRTFWLGQLAAAGRINACTYADDPTLRKLIDVVPFGIDPTPPNQAEPVLKGVLPGIENDDFLLLWAGGVYNWFDPNTLIDAVADLATEFSQLKLVFLGTAHPSSEGVSTDTLRAAIAKAEQRQVLNKHVFFRAGWVPYTERGAYLCEADIGISTHLPGIETQFSFRTRILDYLWAGLPIVSTDGDFFADLIRARALGAVVPPGDVAALAAALRPFLSDRDLLARTRANVLAAAEEFHWNRALAPLLAYCSKGRPAPDRGLAKIASSGLLNRIARMRGPRLAHAVEYLEVNGLAHFLKRGFREVVTIATSRLARIFRR